MIGALGVEYLLRDSLALLGVKKHSMDNLQPAALLGLVHILRKVLYIPSNPSNCRQMAEDTYQQTLWGKPEARNNIIDNDDI